jgi:glycosyltransferase involved in cell wall biosynthesis
MIDDLIDQVPEKSSAYRTIKRSFRDAKPRIRRALSNCDRVIVSTEPLAKYCHGMIDDIKIVPNSLESDVWCGLESKRQQGGKIRVGWAGALQHQGDLEMIAEVVKQTSSEVDWVFMGMCLESIKPYIKEFQESVNISDYPKVLAGLNLDLAIAPLEDNSFNEAKSNLRILEYGILGWPVICSDVYPYQAYDAPVTRVSNTTEDWINAIRMHANDLDMAHQAGDRLREWVLKNFLLEDRLEEWQGALLSGKVASKTVAGR